MNIPNITVEMSDNTLSVNFDLNLDSCCKAIWKIIGDDMNSVIGYRSDVAIGMANQIAKQRLYDLYNKGYLYQEFDYSWKFDALRFVLNGFGHDIRRGVICSEGHIRFTGYKKYIECLIEDNGELCEQIKSLPATTIEQLQDIFTDDIFNQAVELYKDHYIKGLAGI